MTVTNNKRLKQINRRISSKYSHLIYKDEQGDSFIITKFMEIFPRTNNTCGVCFIRGNSPLMKDIRRDIAIDGEWEDDNGIVSFTIENKDVESLIEYGYHKHRFHKDGRFCKEIERLLGHKVIPMKIGKNKFKA